MKDKQIKLAQHLLVKYSVKFVKDITNGRDK